MFWKLVERADYRARCLADRHYSRRKIGAREFCPPGNNIVLLGLNDDALWVSHRPDPNANLAMKRQDGFDYYDNPYFRNESVNRASDMIREALAITRYLWQDYQPPDGFHSFVDERKVKPIRVHGKEVYGWVFLKAGFDLYPHRTKSNKLLRYIIPLDRWLQIEPIAPMIEVEQLSLFVETKV